MSEIEMETFPFSVSGNYTIIVELPWSECVVQGVGEKDWEEQDGCWRSRTRRACELWLFFGNIAQNVHIQI